MNDLVKGFMFGLAIVCITILLIDAITLAQAHACVRERGLIFIRIMNQYAGPLDACGSRHVVKVRRKRR